MLGEESIPLPLCSSEIPHGLARDRRVAPVDYPPESRAAFNYTDDITTNAGIFFI